LISLALTDDVLAIAANKSDGKDSAIVCEALNIIISPHIEMERIQKRIGKQIQAKKDSITEYQKIFSTSITKSKYILHVESTSFLSNLALIYGNYMLIP
jgi:hypothetical protein